MSEKMHHEFELWFYGESGLKCKFDSRGDAYVTESSRTTGDTIVNSSCCIAWQAWQASRAALMVELPPQWFSNVDDEEVMSAIDVIDHLTDAGVGYK